MNDISPDFKPDRYDSEVMQELLKHEGTGTAIRRFSNLHRGMSDYGYWFALGTLWVSYTGWSDLDLWKKLFSSGRPNRRTSLMKPSELSALDALPDVFHIYRAPRPDECDWIAYTTSLDKAKMFAAQRKSDVIAHYLVKKEDVLAYFTRRGEFEILVLDREKLNLMQIMDVVYV